jgi:NOL1/NOP2/fmu family ribosome biogenesis protein
LLKDHRYRAVIGYRARTAVERLAGHDLRADDHGGRGRAAIAVQNRGIGGGKITSELL